LLKAQPLLTAITAPSSSLLLRKEVAVLAGITQAELESLYAIKPVAPAPRSALPKSKRSSPSGLRTLLRCLVIRPELARELPNDWQGDGAEGAAISALADWLRESADETSTSAMIQHFQGTTYEVVFASAQGDVMNWGDDFDVEAEFAGSLEKLRDESRKSELEILHSRGLNSLNEHERARYLQLLRRGQT
jgi:DNA primase